MFERDKGICALCGTDTEALSKELINRFRDLPGVLERNRELRRLGYNPGQSFWEADHIVPVVEGGGECGLDNYRTLCVPCHKQVTQELRSRLAAQNKNQIELFEGGEPIDTRRSDG